MTANGPSSFGIAATIGSADTMGALLTCDSKIRPTGLTKNQPARRVSQI
jgi:hypothetical protein